MKVIVIGGGQVGTYLAGLLLNNGCEVTVIERREKAVERLKKELPESAVVFGSGTDPELLEAAGIAEAKVVATVTGEDETNLVAATIAKYEFGVSRVIARVNNPKNAWLFNMGMGVDVALNQADFMAHLVMEEIDIKNILTLMTINRGRHSILQVSVSEGSAAANKAVKELDIPKMAVIISICRNSGVIIPRGDTVILAGDNVLLFSEDEAKSKIDRLFGPGD